MNINLSKSVDHTYTTKHSHKIQMHIEISEVNDLIGTFLSKLLLICCTLIIYFAILSMISELFIIFNELFHFSSFNSAEKLTVFQKSRNVFTWNDKGISFGFKNKVFINIIPENISVE